MSLVESSQRSLEDDESFIILGTTPTPSMDIYSIAPVSSQPASVVEREIAELAKSLPTVTKMETSTQLDSTTYSLLPNAGPVLSASTIASQPAKSLHESSSSPSASPKVSMMVASTESVQQVPSSLRSTKGSLKSLQSIENKENSVPPMVTSVSQTPTASFILGETQSILHQFPSLAQSSVSFEEIQLLQKLSMEHSQLKESLQRANVAMRKNFTSIQQLQDETKARCAAQDALIEQQKQQIEQLTEANGRLAGELAAARKEHTEKEKEHQNTIVELQTELSEIGRVREVERNAAQYEVDELKKESSERQAIIQNLSKHIERLELQIKGFVVVNTNKPEGDDGKASFVSEETHKRELKQIERRLSVEVAKNLEFEDMRKVYVDEINCLKANLKTAEQVYAAGRVEAQQQFDDIKARDETIAQLRQQITTLEERVQMLTVQSDIFQKDFEAERTAREELAGEKSRILGEFEVLQRRNAELTAQVSQTESDRAETAQRAAKMVQQATSSQEAAGTNNTPANQPEEEQKEPLSLLRCPLCLKGYKDFSSLQSHAADCMGIE
ncbi:NF-kappa-B essential modulator isoform X1 [Anopheles gambiae]|uniref:NF-kappa-B essential modulator isoform X1 n=1 Tax=Anopheles gambiae TaxID=7165 RepID=UPI002AC9A771|nr:NF-kappa-B essential modulator isoform X1 [Anopheles gambiae]